MSACQGASLGVDGDGPLECDDDVDDNLAKTTPAVTLEAGTLEWRAADTMRVIQIFSV
jgi:hypothetical protein